MKGNPNWERDIRQAEIIADQRRTGAALKHKHSPKGYRTSSGLSCFTLVVIAMTGIAMTVIALII